MRGGRRDGRESLFWICLILDRHRTFVYNTGMVTFQTIPDDTKTKAHIMITVYILSSCVYIFALYPEVALLNESF